MKKIPTIFKRNINNMGLVLPEVNPLCEWVLAGEGVATLKYDGTCCLFEGGQWYKRREVKPGKQSPDDFIEVDFDQNTGKRVGWVLINKNDKWHLEAIQEKIHYEPGTYELIGPKVQGNPEGIDAHRMIKHSSALQYDISDRTFYGLRESLRNKDIEGYVFHHPDGRMAKIKKRDFGMKRK